jgi:hypothetical protein
MNFYERYFIYVNSVRKDPLAEIIITVQEGSDYEKIHNFSLLDTDKLNDIGSLMTGSNAEALIESYSEQNDVELASQVEDARFYGYEIVRSSGVTYIAVDLSQKKDGNDIYSRQYSTVVNGDLISLVYKSYTGKITADDLVTFERVISSVQFDQIHEKPTKSVQSVLRSENFFASSILGAIGFLIIGYFLMRSKFKKKKKKIK